MYRTCIATIDASRARILTLDRIADATGVRDELVEHEDLVNPERRMPVGDLFTDRPGRGTTGVRGFGVDDHRRDPIEQFDAAFARQIARRIAAHTQDLRVRLLVVCASPHMLGELRHHAALYGRSRLAVHELAANLVDLPAHQLHGQLAARGLVPPPALR